ncbi:MAG TPA: hypothetical protein PKD53_18135 [Chloroflexaceae bacterium]|nr:hypothetical protein [Chloroflexaceae bacterium]
MPGQPQIAGFLTLDVVSVEAAESTTGTLTPITIIDPGQPFDVWTKVDLNGALISLLSGSAWTVAYYAERMGAGGDVDLGTKTGNWPTIAAGETSKSLDQAETGLTVTLGTAAPGLYKLTCVFTSGASAYILGFAEGGMFQVAG